MGVRRNYVRTRAELLKEDVSKESLALAQAACDRTLTCLSASRSKTPAIFSLRGVQQIKLGEGKWQKGFAKPFLGSYVCSCGNSRTPDTKSPFFGLKRVENTPTEH